jgi:hypothetical protein
MIRVAEHHHFFAAPAQLQSIPKNLKRPKFNKLDEGKF